MSYEKVNPILEGLKVDEAGIRDIKETGKILSDINAKLKETDNKELLKEILKDISFKIDKENVNKKKSTINIFGKKFTTPLSQKDAVELGEQFVNGYESRKIEDKFLDTEIPTALLKPVFPDDYEEHKYIRNLFHISNYQKCDYKDYGVGEVRPYEKGVVYIWMTFGGYHLYLKDCTKELEEFLFDKIKSILIKECPGIFQLKDSKSEFEKKNDLGRLAMGISFDVYYDPKTINK